MTHEELLAKIHKAYLKGHTGYMSNALCAVVELHKPYDHPSLYSETPMLLCSECTLGGVKHESYPCPTIQAIEKELQ